MSVPARPKILVVRGGAIGDFILTLPVFSALRDQFPAAALEAVGYPQLCQLGLASGLLESFHPIEARSLAGFFARKGELDPALCKFFAGFGLIISYLYDPDEIFRSNVNSCSRAQFIQGPHRPDENSETHATAVFLKPLERLAIFDPDPTPRLQLGEGQLPARTTVAAHIGSGSERKNWPVTRWIEWIELFCQQCNWRLLIFSGEADRARLQVLSLHLPEDRVEIYQNAPLLQVAKSLAQCHAFVGHDSGITHLAAAVGVPLLVLWGESKEAIWKPKSDSITLLKGRPSLDTLGAGEVWLNLKELLHRCG